MHKTPTALAGTSPKYDNEKFVCGFSLYLVGFGGGRRGSGVMARVEGLRGRMAESARQIEGLFESLLAESFG
jgi:hypothetical protein